MCLWSKSIVITSLSRSQRRTFNAVSESDLALERIVVCSSSRFRLEWGEETWAWMLLSFIFLVLFSMWVEKGVFSFFFFFLVKTIMEIRKGSNSNRLHFGLTVILYLCKGYLESSSLGTVGWSYLYLEIPEVIDRYESFNLI